MQDWSDYLASPPARVVELPRLRQNDARERRRAPARSWSPHQRSFAEATAGAGLDPETTFYALRSVVPEFTGTAAPDLGFAVARSRDLLRRLLKEHVTDDARQVLAERAIEHLELSGFEIDEAEQVMRKRPPTPLHGQAFASLRPFRRRLGSRVGGGRAA